MTTSIFGRNPELDGAVTLHVITDPAYLKAKETGSSPDEGTVVISQLGGGALHSFTIGQYGATQAAPQRGIVL